MIDFCRLHQRIDDSGRFCAIGRIGKQPAFAPDHKRTDSVLDLIIADPNLAMIKESTEVFLLVEGVGYRFFQLACRARDRLDPGIVA